nr:MAG: hypothetical protein DiTV3a_F7ORF2 [Diabrotica toursvirus 3a]
MNLFNLRVVLPKTDNTPEDKVALKKIVDTFQDIIGPTTYCIFHSRTRVFTVDSKVEKSRAK